MPVYRIAVSLYCILAALWLPGEPSTLMGLDDGSVRRLALTTGRAEGNTTSIVQPLSGAAVVADSAPFARFISP